MTVVSSFVLEIAEGNMKTAPTEVVTLREAAGILNCHISTLDRLIRNKGIRAFKVGSNWRIRRKDLDALMVGAGDGKAAE